jgi:hypothetical protein
MKKLLIAFALLSLLAKPAIAHRLDEYLQATILSLEPHAVRGTIRLVPGVAVASGIIASIDTNGDGTLSQTEQSAYARRALSDLSLMEDGHELKLQLVAAAYPSVDEMKAGTGEIKLNFAADYPSAAGNHELTFENHHQSGISVYLVNTLVPRDEHIRIREQNRNQSQSLYHVSFFQSPAASAPVRSLTWSGFGGAFRLGVRHIADGTDHVLFLLTLMLPAPILAYAGRWSGQAGIRRSLLQILRIVTAFTLGHSLTLALAGFGLIRLPSRPVEALIAISILVSALHALRPMFPGREAAIAAFFGLIHGLAFASALTELGMTGWYRLVSVLGFNLGIEVMQLAVVAATLPSLLLLSRTSFYPVFRICGALVAIAASLAWVFERLSDKQNVIGSAVERTAHYSALLAVGLLMSSIFIWLFDRAEQVFREFRWHLFKTSTSICKSASYDRS